ncbi:hypothetical protein [Streptomyces sp. NBC_01497]|uniref:hypothetical protein n=1 Tax=Streptomyces sp. NBC_01497 TaxID=2903885 RepID=UPI002E32F33A|nr:hypothetical protein [Streptomyces sp. NBC_01497]
MFSRKTNETPHTTRQGNEPGEERSGVTDEAGAAGMTDPDALEGPDGFDETGGPRAAREPRRADRDGIDGDTVGTTRRGGRETRDGVGGHDAALSDEPLSGEAFAGVDEELPTPASRAAEEARQDGAGSRSTRSTGDLYGDRERIVRRERALSRERDLRDSAARDGNGTAGTVGAEGASRATGAGRTGFDKAVPAVTEGRLMPEAESEELSRRLQGALTHFVDDPGRSVEEAACVLEEASRKLAAALEERPRALRADWDTRTGSGGKDAKADTERLRLALRTYRETTERLLAL